MVESQVHRGPDDHGVWIDPAGIVSLGHCRLAIIDLSPRGRQPMISSCGRYVVVLNGEIYNYLELKDLLRQEGVGFQGSSDTEVLLAGISAWGLEVTLERVIGMFAIGLWDTQDRKLYLVRDRAGKKPLYYLKKGDELYFASEMKAFKALEDISLSVSEGEIYQYLTFGYIPSPRTVYREVEEVRAGHYLVVGGKEGPVEHRYWSLPKRDNNLKLDFREAVEETERILKEAVKIRLRTHVPLGCFLSGGVDSGLLTAFASLQMGEKLRTFTVSLEDDRMDESGSAELVARRYATDHHVLRVRADAENNLFELIKAYDEPFADPSAIPSLCVSAEARKHVKVVINGEGGDELFGGYRRHLAMKFSDKVPSWFSFLTRINLPQPKVYRSPYAFAHRFLRGLDKDPYDRYIAWCVDGFSEGEKERLYKILPENRRSPKDILRQKETDLTAEDPFSRFVAWDFVLNMHDDMLVKMDIATMAHGLEGRNPFLDHRLIEWAFRIPKQILLKGFHTKPILRAIARKYLPREVSTAPKRGFEIPIIEWLRRDLYGLVRDVCLARRGIVVELFDRSYLEDLLAERLPLDPDRWSRRVWMILILALWGEMNENSVCMSR